MSLSIKGLALSALLSAASQSALAVTYDFRYQLINSGPVNYAGPYLVTGSFDGTDDGVFVTDISNLSAALDGESFTGLLEIGSSNGPLAVSFVLANNQFAISGGDDGFALGTPPVDSSAAWAYTNVFEAASFRYVYENVTAGTPPQGDWSLTARPTVPVPEPSTYALFALGLAGIGVASRRRRED